MTSPAVYIVGTGPGDPALITTRGRKLLERADVVVYDHQVSEALLRVAPPAAERIDVGAAAPRPLDQEAISILLAEKVREGKSVVRLKWGDPFVFDSGGKEALLLREQQIPFEVVPGVPAAIGAAAYAGIPITYPGADDVVTFVRGHEGRSDEAPEVNWKALATIGGTIVCYASARQIAAITANLISNGRAPDEPAALIYQGTTPSQRTISATLERIADVAHADAPAVLVIGRVAALREHLRWFDDRPLFGRRIVVTRSREQARELMDLLEELGAEAISAPTIRIAPPEDLRPLDAAVADAGSYRWIIFTSGNAVESFMARLLARNDVRELKGVRICTVGPSTAARVQQYGIRVDLTPAEFRAEAIVAALQRTDTIEGARVLLPHADLARDSLAEALRLAGAEVTDVVAYRTKLASAESLDGSDVYRMLLDGQIDAVTFTSASTVKNFAHIHGEDQAADLLRGTTVACIGPVTAEAAQQLGIEPTVIPARYTIGDLVDALVAHFQGREPRTDGT